MNADVLSRLEFDRLIPFLGGVMTSGLREMALSHLEIASDLAVVREKLALTTEARAVVEASGSFPLGGAEDLRPLVRMAEGDAAALTPRDLRTVCGTLEVMRRARASFEALRAERPLLWAVVSPLVPLRHLEEAIERAISPRGEVVDTASPALAEIRRRLARGRKDVLAALHALLATDSYSHAIQERIVTQRGGRYVIPVKASAQSAMAGLVHDQSASGATVYVEPLATLAAQNDLIRWACEEEEEVRRILARLTRAVADARETIEGNLGIVARLDLLSALGQASVILGGVPPQVTDRGPIRLLQARHPFLVLRDRARRADPADRPAQDGGSPRTVPVDILLDDGVQALVISGANAGGKTVALKTLGLLSLMAQAGMHVPAAEGSRLRLFPRIAADIGDAQDIAGDLSTFTAHLTTIRRVVAEADAQTLVLLDELGTGTDPKEGGALGVAFLDALRDRGATVVVTTHLQDLIRYAFLEKGCENASVHLDAATLAPTYTLSYGLPGSSQALAIARRLGVSDAVIRRAQTWLGRREVEVGQLLEALAAREAEVGREVAEAQRIRRDLEVLRDRRARTLARVREKWDALLADRRRKVVALTDDAERRLREALALVKTRPREGLEQVRAIKREAQALPARRSRPGPRVTGLRRGEPVRVRPLGTSGTVLRVEEGKDRAVVQVGPVRVTGSLRDVARPSPGDAPAVPPPPVRVDADTDTRTDLRLVGLTVDEAIPLLDKFIDRALLSGLASFTVVHGIGTGTLRAAVRQYLAAHPAVKRATAGSPFPGGGATTVVELRD